MQIKNGVDAKLEDYFTHLLQIPLNKVTAPPGPTVIIIDALDELTVEQRAKIIDLILKCLHLLPVWVKLLITSRPEKDIVDALVSYKPVKIEDTDPNHVQDLKQYVEEELRAKVGEGDLKAAVDIFMAKSEGKFIYAAYVIKVTIRHGDKFSLNQLQSALPDGMDKVYETNFVRMVESLKSKKPTDKAADLLLPLLQLLTVSREPMSVEFVAQLLDASESDMVKLISVVAPAFPLRTDSAGVRRFYPYHKSVVDWLLKDKDSAKSALFNLEVSACHALAATKLTQLIKGYGSPAWMLPSSCNYLYTHLLDHLHLADRDSELTEFVFRLDWLQKALAIRGANEFCKDLVRYQGYLPDAELKVLIATVKLSIHVLRVSRAVIFVYLAIISRLLMLTYCTVNMAEKYRVSGPADLWPPAPESGQHNGADLH